MKSIQELDLHSPDQMAVTEVFEDEKYKNLAYLQILNAIEGITKIVVKIPPPIWERVVWELNEKARQTGKAVDRAKAEVFWNYFNAFIQSVEISKDVPSEDCEADSRADFQKKMEAFHPNSGGVGECQCAACTFFREGAKRDQPITPD